MGLCGLQAMFARTMPASAQLRELDVVTRGLYTTIMGIHVRGEVPSYLVNPSSSRSLRQSVSAAFVHATKLAGVVIDHRLVVNAPEDAAIVTAFNTIVEASKACKPTEFVDVHVLQSDDGRRLWTGKFTPKRIAAPLDEFTRELGVHLGVPLSLVQVETLKSVVDDAGCKLVSVFKFNEFLNAFGPTVESAIRTMERSMQVCQSCPAAISAGLRAIEVFQWADGLLHRPTALHAAVLVNVRRAVLGHARLRRLCAAFARDYN